MRRGSQRRLLEEAVVREAGVVSQNSLAPEQAGSGDVLEQRSRSQVTNNDDIFSARVTISWVLIHFLPLGILTGQSDTGAEIVARDIHQPSRRRLDIVSAPASDWPGGRLRGKEGSSTQLIASLCQVETNSLFQVLSFMR